MRTKLRKGSVEAEQGLADKKGTKKKKKRKTCEGGEESGDGI